MERHGYALELAYAGTGFSGFARQPGRRTVEAVLQRALGQLGIEVALAVAGRTDAGVHARRQVVSFRIRRRLDPTQLRADLRRALADHPDLWLLRAAAVDRSFHARASAQHRTYQFRVRVGGPPARLRLRLPDDVPLDWEAAQRFLTEQCGAHDRSPFTTRPAGSKITRLESVAIQHQPGRRVAVIFRADGYTRHLVRNWMAAALALARGQRLPPAGPTGFHGRAAPAIGLCLWAIEYPADPFSAPDSKD